MFQPEELTGALVMQVRTNKGMSRVQFSELAGLAGRSTARLNNIERRDSWKPGDREAVARVLNELVPHFDPRYLAGGGLTVPGAVDPKIKRPESNEDAPPITVSLADDSDLEDELPLVGPAPSLPAITVADGSTIVAADTLDLPPPVPTVVVPDGHYPVSNSELQTWKRCRRKWWLAWYRGLALRTETFVGVRSVGDRIHRALQRWYVPDGTPRVDPRDALERVVVEDWTRVVELARARHVTEEQLAVLAKEFADSTNLERAMVEGYVRWLEESGADAELRVIASETPLAAHMLVDVDGVERPISMIGKLDARLKRVTDDVNLFLDHKTVGDLKAPAVTLPQNEQVLHYLLLEYLSAIQEEVSARNTDESLPSATYVFREQPTSSVAVSLLSNIDHGQGTIPLGDTSPRREPTEQRPDQPRTVMLGMPQFTSQQGQHTNVYRGAQAQDQRSRQESRSSNSPLVGGIEAEDVRVDEESLARASQRVSSGALYNMLKRSKRTSRAIPPFYDRIEVRHNSYELESYKRRMLATIRDIVRAIDALNSGVAHQDVVYPSPNPTCKWDCDFFAVCNLFDDGSPGVDDMVDALYHEVDPRDRYDVRSTDE